MGRGWEGERGGELVDWAVFGGGTVAETGVRRSRPPAPAVGGTDERPDAAYRDWAVRESSGRAPSRAPGKRNSPLRRG